MDSNRKGAVWLGFSKTAHLGKVLAFGIRAGDARAAGEPLRVGVPGAEDATL